MNSYEWKYLSKNPIENEQSLLTILAQNRNIKDIKSFVNPPYPTQYLNQDVKFTKLIKDAVEPSAKLIKDVIVNRTPIVIHGDYDVDGQSATAILWRTIYNDLDYKNVYPYIPNRFTDGYGLSKKSIENVIKLLKIKYFDSKNAKPLLITVDCGITAVEEVEYAKKQGFKVIITDHHEKGKSLPKAKFIIHTKRTTGAGIAWILSHFLIKAQRSSAKGPTSMVKDQPQWSRPNLKYLDLAALGTVADLQPLTGFNRSIVKHGIDEINKKPLVGIQALKKIAGTKDQITTYEIGWVIAPRLNAAGRLENAMDSLKLLCTESKKQAAEIANKLDKINKIRQDKTFLDVQSAYTEFDQINKDKLPPILVTINENYHEGIIGLIAGKLTQTYNRATIAISIDNKTQIAKGSARSIPGISIVKTLQKFDDLLVSMGGHDMAAGFSIKVENLKKLQTKILNLKDNWSSDIFKKKLIVDLELPADLINFDTYHNVQKLNPFGVGNFEPVFSTKNLSVFSLQSFGKENKHLKLFLTANGGRKFEALAFNKGFLAEQIEIGQKVNVAYQLGKNTWNGKSRIQLKLKDIKAQSFINTAKTSNLTKT